MSRAAAYGISFGVALATTLVLTPLVRRLAFRIGAVVKPDERRVHTRPTATIGGIAMYGGFVAGFGTAWVLGAFDEAFSGSTEPIGILLAAFVMLVIGVVDDLREVSAPARIAGTVLAASLLVFSGVAILVLRVPFERALTEDTNLLYLDGNTSFLLSVIWVVGMTQAVNLIDGLDGLAAGIVGIASAAFFFFALRLGDEGLLSPDNLGPLVALLILAICLGFLPYNAHPARIFMGDAGALLLGLLMAAATMMVGGRSDQPYSGQVFFFYAPIVIPLLILAVPILDTAFAIVRRAAKRSGVAEADKDHLHHRLLRLGHGHRRAVFILWGWTALLAGFVLYPIYTGRGDGIVPFAVLGLALALFTVLHPQLRKRTEVEEPDEPDLSPGTEPAMSDPAARDLADASIEDGKRIRQRAGRQRAERRARGRGSDLRRRSGPA